MTPDALADRAATGYSIVLAPGWRRIALRERLDEQIGDLLGEVVSAVVTHAPPDRLRRYRAEFEHLLTEAVRQAREQRCIDLYLPLLSQPGTPVPASFVVSDRRLFAGDPEVMNRLAGRDSAMRPATVDGTQGFRVERLVSPAADKGIYFRSRRVDYLIPVPGSQGRWLVFAFTTFGAGDPSDSVAQLLAKLFDAMMSNFRWQWETS